VRKRASLLPASKVLRVPPDFRFASEGEGRRFKRADQCVLPSVRADKLDHEVPEMRSEGVRSKKIRQSCLLVFFLWGASDYH
jgi:hypothetical protein